jgi:hypothetical protein
MKRGTRALGMDIFSLLFLSVGIVLAVVILLINDPKKQDNEAPDPQGTLIVQIYWPEYHCDVDLWVRGPDNVSVGYSNKGAAVFNLLRDDLGLTSDLSGVNEEVAVSRGLPNGQYIINVHLFQKKAGILPIPVKLVVGLKMHGGFYQQLFVVDTELTAEGQERTMARFVVRNDRVDRDSFNTIQQSIRANRTNALAPDQ